jgi:hypothetical protein
MKYVLNEGMYCYVFTYIFIMQAQVVEFETRIRVRSFLLCDVASRDVI